MFLFSHLTYLVQILYFGKLSRPRYQQELNKIMKISQEDVILIKNLYLSKQCGARWTLSELPDKGWKLGSIDSLLKRSQDGYDCPRIRRVAVEDLVLSQEDKPKGIGELVKFRTKLPFSIQVMYTGKQFTVICSSHASNDVVLSCCLKPIVSPVSLSDKQRYRLQ